MMNAVVKPYHEMCLNSSELIVPRDTYQRALHPARVARIAKEFDERVANEPKISFRDGHYTLIRQGKLKAETVDFWMRIPKEEFERWYRSQSRHRTAADRERDREIEAQTISIPEMAKLLGIPREKVYWILDCKKYRDCFVIERVADRRRITKTSFEIWLNSQSTYRLQEPVMEAHEEPPLELKCPKSEKYYSFQEIQDFYGVSRTTLVTWIREEGIPTIDVGRAKRVRKDVFDDVLKSKCKVEGDT